MSFFEASVSFFLIIFFGFIIGLVFFKPLIATPNIPKYCEELDGNYSYVNSYEMPNGQRYYQFKHGDKLITTVRVDKE